MAADTTKADSGPAERQFVRCGRGAPVPVLVPALEISAFGFSAAFIRYQKLLITTRWVG